MKRAFQPLTPFILLRLLTIVLLISSCKSENTEPLRIQPLPQLNRTYETEANGYIYHSKIEHYLLDGLQDNAEEAAKVDSFVCVNIASDYTDFHTYMIYFYKKSKNTNVEAIAADPREWIRYYQDEAMVYSYRWVSGEFRYVTKWNNFIEIEDRYKLLCSPN